MWTGGMDVSCTSQLSGFIVYQKSLGKTYYYIFRISSSVLWSIERHVQYRFIPGPVYGLLRVRLYDVIKEFYKGLQA